jgi:predicted metal-dependent hydrolase
MTLELEFVKGPNFIAKVVRTGRRETATIKVVEGKVSVVVPHRTSAAYIEDLVSKKTPWIREKLLLQREYQPPKPKEYVSGESFPYLGRNYRLKVVPVPEKSVKLLNGRLVVQVPPLIKAREQYIRNVLVDWYKEHALEKLREKVEHYSKIIGVRPSSVVIKSFKGRWGGCHMQGKVDFNWKIIMAPNRIVDYVVVHELCHLHHYNHSPDFWMCVKRAFNNYQECRCWLKENGRLLNI